MNVFQFFIICKRTNNANNATHYVKLGKKRRESSKRNYYIISPRVIIKAIIIEYLLTNLALRVTIPLGHAAKTRAILGPFEDDVLPIWPGSRNAIMVLVGGMDTGLKPGGGGMSIKSSLLFHDAASSSSEDMSTTAG